MNRILIVEDDSVVANIYANKFRVEGYIVEWARDGEEAKKQAPVFKPDLVLLDLTLPKVSGVEIIKFLRGHPALKALPIVVFSNLYLTNQIQEAWKAGATKCLSKVDCTPKQLVEIINQIMRAPAPVPPPPTTAGAPRGAAPPAAETDLDSDEAFQADLRRTFLEGAPQTMGSLRTIFAGLSRATTEAQRLAGLRDLSGQVRLLASNAGMVGFSHIARLAAALEALLKEMYEKPRNITASTQRTVAQTVDFFTILFQEGTASEELDLASISALVVDDEVISRRAVTRSLDKAGLKSISLEDPFVALQLLGESRFDLIVLDVEMPGLSGFDLCARVRGLPQYRATPVVFVTSHTDFESRAKSILSGGNDLIAKPFVFMELAVKALNHVLRSRLVKTPAPPPDSPAGAPRGGSR